MKEVPYTLALGSLMYAMLCNRPNIYYIVGMVSKYESNPKLEHWTVLKHIFKYFKRTRDYMLTYKGSDLILIDYKRSISCQTWILKSQLSCMCSQWLGVLGVVEYPTTWL